MASTTIVQHWQLEQTVYQTEQTNAVTALTSLQTELGRATTQLNTDTTAFQQTVADIARWRAQLATTTVPADAAALLAKITKRMIDQRHLQGSLLEDGEHIARIQAQVDATTALQTRATARLAAATTSLATAQTDATQRQSLITALGSPPLSTIANDATTFLGGTTYSNATQQLTANFPASLQTLARARHDRRAGRVTDLQASVVAANAKLGTEYNADGGKAGAAAQAAIAFQQAVSDARTFVQTAKLRFDAAVAVMQKLEAIKLDTTGATPDILTANEKAALTTATAAVPGSAITEAGTIDTDRKTLYAALTSLDGAILTQIMSNVDGLPGSIGAAQTAVDGAATQITNDLKPAVFPDADKTALDQWEAVIPDTAWQSLLDFEEADVTLKEFSTLVANSKDPATLVAALDETNYAKALDDAAIAQRRVDFLGDEITRRTELRDAALQIRATRLLSAIRGDNF